MANKKSSLSTLSLSCEKISRIVVKITIWIFVLVYVIIPGTIYFYPSLITNAVFMRIASTGNFTDFKSYGRTAQNTRNFYLPVTDENIKLGVWHLIPKADEAPLSLKNTDEHFEKLLSSGKRPIVIYYHGNSLHRAGWFMLHLYNILCQENLQIIAPDYRGYGDSEGVPKTEADVLRDALTIYNYVKKVAPNADVFLWGHSLGTGVVSSLVAQLSDLGDAKWIRGIILEAPFTTIREAGELHPHGTVYRWTPYFETVFLDGFARNNIFFENKHNLVKAECSIMILHAEDDGVVPYSIGKKLANHLRENKKEVSFQGFPSGHGYYHSRLYRAPELPGIIRKFVNKFIQP